MRSPIQFLEDADARLRASVVREVATLRRASRDGWPRYREGRLRTWVCEIRDDLRNLSRQRMEIQHALRALRNPARALAALRVV